ncbi:MAG: NepR family anti-sigma factor [Phenylobacterium sp.]|uniref:NepR family anti-sigma factor n=1 Tax=Phenylobacterium sp. TaxID=1871053 RepID=UPI00273419A1|nr:NepR family anti-sigma factor [Phenylobacterium sp.]MDP3173746.1 NepR family anti-sigma factor [Phenylobacterium sp.]
MARKAVDLDRLTHVDAALRGMFEALQSLPLPSRLLSLIDQLDDDRDEPGADFASGSR